MPDYIIEAQVILWVPNMVDRGEVDSAALDTLLGAWGVEEVRIKHIDEIQEEEKD